jgi:GNAT superfamily N-acetyltransferase
MISPELTFRRAIPDESDLLSAICRRAKRSHGYDEETMQIWLGEGDMVISRESIAKNTIMMALIGDRIVGFAHLMPVDQPDTVYLEDLFIEPDVQGAGVGRALFYWAREEARNRGYDWLEWDSDPNAAAFYRKMGGEEIGGQMSTLIPERFIPKFRMKTTP